MIDELVGSMHAPMNKTIFGCFKLDQIDSSQENSSMIWDSLLSLFGEEDERVEGFATLIAISVVPRSLPK